MDAQWLLLPIFWFVLLLIMCVILARFVRLFSDSWKLAQPEQVVWLECARIATGLILLHRSVRTLAISAFLPTAGYEVAISTFLIVCAVCLLVGFITPLSCLLLLICSPAADQVLHTLTLGSAVMQMVLVTLFLGSTGAALSVDSFLLRSRSFLTIAIAWMYRPFGRPVESRIRLTRIIAFTSYGLVALFSALTHLRDEVWLSGFINVYALTSTYMGIHAQTIRWMIDTVPYPILMLFMMSSYITLVWELVMLPLAASGRVGRLMVITWGVLFFTMSALALGLGWLAYYEFVLWAIIFGPPSWLRKPLTRLSARSGGSALAQAPIGWPRLFRGCVLTYIVLATCYVASLPEAAGYPLVMRVLPSEISIMLPRVTQMVGMVPIYVFGDVDVRMSERWVTISAVHQDGSKRLLPLTASDGHRLSWHASDRIYFGISLPWHRTTIDRPDPCFIPDLEFRYASEIVALDRRLNDPQSTTYQLDFYFEPLPDLDLLRSFRYVQPIARLECSVELLLDPTSGRILGEPRILHRS